MDFNFDERTCDSPLVHVIWRTHNAQADTFISQAVSHWEMVITKLHDAITVTVRGPETEATRAPVPENAEFIGVQFKLGAFMPNLPPVALVDDAVSLPASGEQSFVLDSTTWEIPTYDNMDVFVDRLIRAELLVHDPVVAAALQDRPQEVSLRTVQRRFLRATGLTAGAVHQIERAQQALALLQQGASILDTVEQAGYADQPHLTRSLKRFVGQTPAQIAATAANTTAILAAAH